MKVFDKLKNLFTDEVEDEVKSEMIQVEIPAPAKNDIEKKEEDITDNKIIKSEEKPSAPIFFDDDYFKELEQPKKEVKSSYKKEIKEVEKKIFKPTPIISPVYGVLDKDYQKEEITTKVQKTYKANNISIDDVRKKAFGSLEEDLETTLFGSKSILFNEESETEDKKVDEETDNTDLFDEMTKEDTIDLELSNDELKEENDEIGEDELFDLIDTMYEEGDKK